jgi:hypothetical protein
MTLSWLPNTSQGRMFGDYISTSILAGGNAFPVLPIASAPTGSTFSVPTRVPAGGLQIAGGQRASAGSPAAAPAAASVPAGSVLAR